MQARIVKARQDEDEGSGNTPGEPRAQKVNDELMLANLANDGWAEHTKTTTESD